MAELAISNVALRYGERDVLRGLSVNVPAGKVTALLGPSGSGKTALLRAVAGLETPHAGTIRIGNRVFFDGAQGIDLPPEARGLGLVVQSYALWPHRTVFNNVAYGLKLRRFSGDEVKDKVGRALAQIGLAHLADRYPHQLSAGQQQRVAVARALVYDPPAILLDEPLSDLDAKLREEARAWLRQLIASVKLSALVVTQDQIEAMALADHVALLNAGVIEQQGTPMQLYREPETLFAAEFIGNTNRLEGTLVEMAHGRAIIEVSGNRFEGVVRTKAAIGEKATGIIRVDKVGLGGGPGRNRLFMSLKAQMYVGERWELVFVKDALSVRAHASGSPLKHEGYHVEFPADALWVF
jgi:iron(III) transport system ATP-binding protein